eukprot:m.157505 g.157505  ORF g.157505 m.157505 type:complete len:200 (+) comp10231_c1_seq3:129-728(+)
MASAEERGTVRRLLHLKEQLDLALDKSDMAVAADILSELTQIAMNIELMRATRITTSLGALRKKARDLDPALSDRAKVLSKQWQEMLRKSLRAESATAAAAAAATPPTTTAAAVPVAAAAAAGVRTPLVHPYGSDCPPEPSHEFSAYSPERRWQGVDGCVGPDGRWYRWSEPIPVSQAPPYQPYLIQPYTLTLEDPPIV